MTTEQPAPTSPPSAPPLLVGAPWALGAALAIGAGTTAAAAVVGGSEQVLAALLGTALVCGFFLFGTLNTALAVAVAPRASLVVALAIYTMQVTALGLVLVWVRGRGGDAVVDPDWLAASVILGTLGWTVALVARALLGPETRQ